MNKQERLALLRKRHYLFQQAHLDVVAPEIPEDIRDEVEEEITSLDTFREHQLEKLREMNPSDA